MESLTLAGGCFWCTQAVFRRLKGVNKTTAGYHGGVKNSAQGVEAVMLEFDPKIISLDTLLEIFFHLHNPTTLNRQGADVGPQYRSGIYYSNKNQQITAGKILQGIEKERIYRDKIVTEILPFTQFFPVSENEQDFYEKYRYSPYCQIVIDPKIKKLISEYSDYLIKVN